MQVKFKTELDEFGKISLPLEIISELQLKPGMKLVIEEIDGKISLEPILEEPELINKNGILVVRPQITGDIRNVVQRDRQERIDKIMGDFTTK
jgi:bifunctional DNA-binding transcriptional regulator/antitoxin component of YhaV-PrlF toxin-antitoxin module